AGRRRRDLALVAAAGGRPAQVRRIVLADGVVLGVLSAGAGVALGVAAAAALRAPLESWLGFRSGAFRIFPVALAVLAGLAVVTGVLAALVPAWISSRQDVVTALTGRRGITRSKRRWVIVGVALIAAGAGLVALGAVRIDETTMVAGVFLAELGLVLCTPAIVGLVARLGRWLPLAARIALQDTSRNRTAAAPAVAAVMAVVIFSVALGIVYLSLRARDASESAGRPGDVTVFQTDRDGAPSQTISQEAIRTVRELMPVDQVYEIQMPRCGFGPCLAHPELPAVLQCPYPPFDSTPDQQRAARSDPRCDGVGAQHVYFGAIGIGQGVAVIVDETAVAAVAVVSQEDADRVVGAMRGGAVVVSDPRYLENGRVTLAVEAIGSNQQRTLTAPAVALPHRPKAPIALMTAATARTLGFDPVPFMTLATTTRVPTLAEEDRLQAALGSQFHVSVLRAVQPADDRTLVVLAIVAAVITIGAAALATGLAAADGRADLGTLAAVGASPRLRRVLSLSQTGVIAGLGSVLGVAAGLGLSTAVLFALNQRFADTWPVPTPIPVTVPWLNVGIALLVVPLIAMLGTGLLTRSRLPIERRL
ncbi:MAG TPA: FtsX-like permease family protein, partial [Actinophytocola sp.]|uniref:FtsX-like permease family protein n=1 Tax=Actinophytocola sp. TaxID=1872138 RepID=UPI002DDD8E2E